MLYLGTWKIMDSARVPCMTYFASMTPEDDEKERFSCQDCGEYDYKMYMVMMIYGINMVMMN